MIVSRPDLKDFCVEYDLEKTLDIRKFIDLMKSPEGGIT